MALTDERLTIREAHQLMDLNGMNISFGWLRILVWNGKIPSEKILGLRVVSRGVVMEVIQNYKLRKAGLK